MPERDLTTDALLWAFVDVFFASTGLWDGEK